MKRIFLIVLDSLGIGALPDAVAFGDAGANTFKAVSSHPKCDIPTLTALGIGNIDGVVGYRVESPKASYARMGELSLGKDTTIGHWEMAGLVSSSPLPTYPNGFPKEIIEEFEARTGRKVICNKPYSGTEVIKDYGKEHLESGALIVYTSADSVFQIAAHEDKVDVEELYRYCEIARKIMVGEHGVGRIIARPFSGSYPFTRTANRHDFSIEPPRDTMLDLLKKAGLEVISVGKIVDIFSGKGITKSYRTGSNDEGMRVAIQLLDEAFEGLCFVNLVDFDMKFGHRNDVLGYANALSECDKALGEFILKMKEDDLLIITADHGCDPLTPSTDHSREYVPMLIFGSSVKEGVNLNTRASFSDISATVLEYFGVDKEKTNGISFWDKVKK